MTLPAQETHAATHHTQHVNLPSQQASKIMRRNGPHALTCTFLLLFLFLSPNVLSSTYFLACPDITDMDYPAPSAHETCLKRASTRLNASMHVCSYVCAGLHAWTAMVRAIAHDYLFTLACCCLPLLGAFFGPPPRIGQKSRTQTPAIEADPSWYLLIQRHSRVSAHLADC
jgi:hypothetical protein